MSSLENYYPSIIRLLDVQVIGPYLVKRGVLSSQDYYDNYVGPLQKGDTSNHKLSLSLKLANKCLKKPKDFLEALEESLNSTNHADHQELIELLHGKKKYLVHRAAHTVIKRAFSKQKSEQVLKVNGHVNGHVNGDVSSDSDIDGHLTNGYNSDDDDDEAIVHFDKSSITELSKKGWPLNVSCSSLNISPVFTEKENFRGSTGSLNMSGCHERSRKNSVEHLKCIFNGTASPHQTSPTLKHKRSSTPLFQNIMAKTNHKDEDDKNSQALYEQSEVEIKKLKEKNKLHEETMKTCQSECEELRKQVKELQQLKGRDGNEILKETIEKLKDENKQLNEQVTHFKIEIATLNERLSSKAENEERLETARTEHEKNLQALQVKVDSMTIQLESSNIKLESKQEMVKHLETRNKELTKQLNDLNLKLNEQITHEQTNHQNELAKYQEKCKLLERQVQERDVKISNFEGKMEVTALNLQQIQYLLTTINQREAAKDIVVTVTEEPQKKKSRDHITDSFAKCSKQDLIEIIETHVDQIEALHQKLYRYKREIKNLQRKIQLVI